MLTAPVVITTEFPPSRVPKPQRGECLLFDFLIAALPLPAGLKPIAWPQSGLSGSPPPQPG